MLCYFYAFQLNIDRTTAVLSLVRIYVCLSGCVSVMFGCVGGGLCVCVCLSVRFSAKVCVCVCLSVCSILCLQGSLQRCVRVCVYFNASFMHVK